MIVICLKAFPIVLEGHLNDAIHLWLLFQGYFFSRSLNNKPTFSPACFALFRVLQRLPQQNLCASACKQVCRSMLWGKDVGVPCRFQFFPALWHHPRVALFCFPLSGFRGEAPELCWLNTEVTQAPGAQRIRLSFCMG